MTRVVLDVNVIVSAFPAPHGVPGKLIDAWLHGEFDLIVSEHIVETAGRSWSTVPYFATRYTADQAVEALALLRQQATTVIPVDTVQGVAPNEEDDMVLATAVAGEVDFLVTGDGPFRDVGFYEGIVMISPREFLEQILEKVS